MKIKTACSSHSEPLGALCPERHTGKRCHFNDVAKNNTNHREASAAALGFRRNGWLKLCGSSTLSTGASSIIIVLCVRAVTRHGAELCDVRICH